MSEDPKRPKSRPPRPGGAKRPRPGKRRTPSPPVSSSSPKPPAETWQPEEAPPPILEKAAPTTTLPSARSPDETGMMQITPLSDVVDEPEDTGSATTFFLKEKPKPKPVVQPVTPVVTGQSPPQGGAVPHQPIVGQQSAAASSGFAGISGPVAAGHPQQAATMASHETLSEEPDSGGHKVKILVALLGLAGTGFIGIILVVGLWFFTSTQAEEDPSPEPRVVASNTQKPQASTEDTAIEIEQPPPKPRSYSSGGGSSKQSTSSTSSKPASKPAPPPSGPGPVTIIFSGTVSHSGGQLRCGSGFKASASFQGSKMVFANVPKEDGCSIKLKGGGPANINYGVTANATLNCEYANGGADVKCR